MIIYVENIVLLQEAARRKEVSTQNLSDEDKLIREKAVTLNVISEQDRRINYSERLSPGRFGTVYQASLHGTQVAVKEVKIQKQSRSRVDLTSLTNEIDISATVRHPSIVQFMGYAVDDKRRTIALRLVYELINGDNLNEIIYDDDLYAEYKFSPHKKYDVLLQVAQGLAHLHSQNPQIIHGDIKPANILLSRNGQAKICDLGLSKMKLQTSQTLTTTIGAGRGTPIYMSPEQLLLKKTSSSYSDIYAFGATMYETLFRSPMWDLEDGQSDLDEISQFKLKVEKEKLPLKLPKGTTDTATRLIVTCVQYEPALRAHVRLVISELQKLLDRSLEGN